MSTRKAKKVTKKKPARRSVSPKSAALAYERLQLLTQAVAAEYADDPTGAGVLVSALKTGEYYVAIHRYAERFGEGKKVVASEKSKSLGFAVEAISRRWLGDKSAKQKLARAIRPRRDHGDDYERDDDPDPSDFCGPGGIFGDQ